MVKSIIKFCLLMLLIDSSNHAFAQTSKDKGGFALVELFTSEGCSSCPPADEAVAALVQDYPKHVFVLAFHVDYWNYLGWKDIFSDAVYTKRQEQYATKFALNSIYTPQIVVNGQTQFTGSDKSTLYSTVKSDLKADVTTALLLTAKASSNGDVLVNYTTTNDSKENLCIALVQLQAKSVVTRGENKGKLLHHVDVVRNFKIVSAGTGSVNLSLPAGLKASECKVVGFLQKTSSMQVNGIAEAEIN